ncbi:MAG: efflux RND transporter periplasmic adaptor subunit [Planctomycetota bacterium]|jgi:HlyD family secretion protein
MKKTIIAVVLILIVVGGYLYIGKYARVSLSVLRGETTKTSRGDLIVPITASGNIKPASVTNIKGKASGEVVEIPFDVGKMVKKDDLIVRLDKSDEQRNVDKASADYKRAEIARKQAEVTKKKLEDVGIKLAKAKLDKADARLIRAESELNFLAPKTQPSSDGLPSPITKEEWDVTRCSYQEALADREAADAEYIRARTIDLEQADHDVDIATQNEEAAKKVWEDAKERLEETAVFSPIDGMVLARHVQIGELVMSGTTSLTGGTVMLEIADVSEIYAVVNVDEADIGLVRELAPPSARPGATASQPATLPAGVLVEAQKVKVTVESFPDEDFEGIIERISPQSEVSHAIATFKVRIRITSDNRDKLVGLLNTQAEANFTAQSVSNAILVSYDAIHKNPDGEDFGVYVPIENPGKGKKKYKFRPCKFGVDNGVEVEVVEGLAEGEEVYIKLPKMTRKEKEAEEQSSE